MRKFLIMLSCFLLILSLNTVCYMYTNEMWQMGEIIETSDLDENDSDYWIKIYDPSKKNVRISGIPDENFVENDKKLNNLPMTYTTADTKYNVYSSSGSLKYRNLTSVFDAINKASNYNDYVQESDTGMIVFTKNNSTSTYYKFQFTKFYGTTTSETEIENWINNFSYTHVYDGTGELIRNSYYSIQGIPDSYTLEPHGGGYYAKFSYAYEGFKSASMKANLTSAQMKFSSSSQNNAYIIQAAVTPTQTIEIGIMTGKGFDGKWVIYKNDPKDNFVIFYPNKVVATSSYSNGVYTFNNDVALKLMLTSGGVKGVISSDILSENDGTVYAEGSSFNETASPLSIFHMISFVPVDCDDLRSGAYLKNISLSNCKLYRNTSLSGSSANFYGDSNGSVNYAYIYNDDCITYTKSNSTKETISIDYSASYRE